MVLDRANRNSLCRHLPGTGVMMVTMVDRSPVPLMSGFDPMLKGRASYTNGNAMRRLRLNALGV